MGASHCGFEPKSQISTLKKIQITSCRLVYNRQTQRGRAALSGPVRVCSEQSLCGCVKFDIVLDSMHNHDFHIFGHFP